MAISRIFALLGIPLCTESMMAFHFIFDGQPTDSPLASCGTFYKNIHRISVVHRIANLPRSLGAASASSISPSGGIAAAPALSPTSPFVNGAANVSIKVRTLTPSQSAQPCKLRQHLRTGAV